MYLYTYMLFRYAKKYSPLVMHPEIPGKLIVSAFSSTNDVSMREAPDSQLGPKFDGV